MVEGARGEGMGDGGELFHPDNYPNESPVVRAAMVKAFKLVSESRQDA